MLGKRKSTFKQEIRIIINRMIGEKKVVFLLHIKINIEWYLKKRPVWSHEPLI